MDAWNRGTKEINFQPPCLSSFPFFVRGNGCSVPGCASAVLGEGTAAFLCDTSGFPISCQAALDPWVLPAFPHAQKLQMWGCTLQFETGKIKSAQIQSYIWSQGGNTGKTSCTNKQRSTGCYPDTEIQVERSGISSTLSHTHCSSQWFFTAVLPSIVKSVLWKISQAQARKVNSGLGELGFHPAVCTDSKKNKTNPQVFGFIPFSNTAFQSNHKLFISFPQQKAWISLPRGAAPDFISSTGIFHKHL